MLPSEGFAYAIGVDGHIPLQLGGMPVHLAYHIRCLSWDYVIGTDSAVGSVVRTGFSKLLFSCLALFLDLICIIALDCEGDGYRDVEHGDFRLTIRDQVIL